MPEEKNFEELDNLAEESIKSITGHHGPEMKQAFDNPLTGSSQGTPSEGINHSKHGGASSHKEEKPSLLDNLFPWGGKGGKAKNGKGHGEERHLSPKALKKLEKAVNKSRDRLSKKLSKEMAKMDGSMGRKSSKKAVAAGKLFSGERTYTDEARKKILDARSKRLARQLTEVRESKGVLSKTAHALKDKLPYFGSSSFAKGAKSASKELSTFAKDTAKSEIKAASKASAKLAAATGGKAVTKEAAKLATEAGGKVLAKNATRIGTWASAPTVVGAIAGAAVCIGLGVWYAKDRLGKGDFAGAGMELLSGTAGLIVPPLGTGIDLYLAQRDIRGSEMSSDAQEGILNKFKNKDISGGLRDISDAVKKDATEAYHYVAESDVMINTIAPAAGNAYTAVSNTASDLYHSPTATLRSGAERVGNLAREGKDFVFSGRALQSINGAKETVYNGLRDLYHSETVQSAGSFVREKGSQFAQNTGSYLKNFAQSITPKRSIPGEAMA